MVRRQHKYTTPPGRWPTTASVHRSRDGQEKKMSKKKNEKKGNIASRSVAELFPLRQETGRRRLYAAGKSVCRRTQTDQTDRQTCGLGLRKRNDPKADTASLFCSPVLFLFFSLHSAECRVGKLTGVRVTLSSRVVSEARERARGSSSESIGSEPFGDRS